jgi:DSF synthase
MHLALTSAQDLDVLAQSEPLPVGDSSVIRGSIPRHRQPAHSLERRTAVWQESIRELTLRFDHETKALWCAFNHPARPCFSRPLLSDIKRFQRLLKRDLGQPAIPEGPSLRTLVWHSEFPDVWNLGGDLELFVELIRAGDRESLRLYAHACCETVYANWNKGGGGWRTIALIEGDALGGGFEAAITNDVIIAEQHSKFGLPEILFKMFPGMGAYSFLSRRIGAARAEAVITSGRLYSADEMQAMGVVDLVVPTGQGRAAVDAWIRREDRQRRVLGALAAVRRRCQPVTFDELIDVTEIWVDTAMELEPGDLRKMERLARAQHRRRARDVTREAA